MNQYPAWKYVLIIVILLVGALYALPNLFGEDPALQIILDVGRKFHEFLRCTKIACVTDTCSAGRADHAPFVDQPGDVPSRWNALLAGAPVRNAPRDADGLATRGKELVDQIDPDAFREVVEGAGVHLRQLPNRLFLGARRRLHLGAACLLGAAVGLGGPLAAE